MDRFIELLKKKLLRNMTAEDEKEFEMILNENPELRTIYFQGFSKIVDISSNAELEAEEAFAVHFVKMQLKNNL
jgi:hypothetical protein